MAKSGFITSLEEGFQQDLVDALKRLGHNAMLYAYKMGNRGEAFDEKTPSGKGVVMYKKRWKSHGKARSISTQAGRWQHRSFNLHDSFASAVYVGGKIASVEYLGSQRSNKRDKKTGKTGRTTVDDYLTSHRFGISNNEIVLVVVAAMFYAGILEKGGNSNLGPQDKFLVVSPAEEYIKLNYDSAIAPVLRKYGIKGKPKHKVIAGEKLIKK